MNFKEVYRQLNELIYPENTLIEYTVSLAAARRKKHTSSIRRTAAAACILCAIMYFSLPVLAAHIDPVYRLMYALSPQAAQHFMPVQRACEDQGIRMEVESACIYENSAQIYITMEDLTGDRIDETTDLYDSYSINYPFDAIGTCSLEDYDEATGKASFLIAIDKMPGGRKNHNILGDKITFSVREFLSHKKQYDNILIPIDLSTVPTDSPVQPVEACGLSYSSETYRSIDDNATALIPGAPMEEFPIEGISLTAIGCVDDMLHVQLAVENSLENDNHGYVWLADADGKRLDSVYSIDFRDTDEDKDIRYQEIVFCIPTEGLSDYSLYGHFTISGLKTEGNWRVTFPLESGQ